MLDRMTVFWGKTVVILLCFWFVLGGKGFAGPAREDGGSETGVPPMNLILITIDNWRPDTLETSPAGEQSAPHLEKLANEGVYYDNFFHSTPFAVPNVISLMTGLYPPGHGVRDSTHFQLLEKFETLAERLKRSGYGTYAFIGSTAYSRSLGLAQGFDLYVDDPLDVHGLQTEPFPYRLTASQLNGKILQFLEGRKDTSPFFIWVHYSDLVPPYGTAQQSRSDPDPYDAAVRGMDKAVGQLMDQFQKQDLLKSSLVVVVGTQSQNLGEHHETVPGSALYDIDLKTPLILSHPASFPTAVKMPNLARGIDLTPSILSILSIKPSASLDGQSVVPFEGNGGAQGPDSLYIENFLPVEFFGLLPLRGVRSFTQKLVADGKEKLFWDLAGDPFEVSDPKKEGKGLKEQELEKTLAGLLKGFDNSITEEAYRGRGLEKPEFKLRFTETTGIAPKDSFLAGLRTQEQDSTFSEALAFHENLRAPGPKNWLQLTENVQKRIDKNFASRQDHLLLAELYRHNPQKELSTLSELYFALQIDPLSPATYGEIAREHERHKDAEGMSAIWRLAQAANPDWALPYVNLAMIDMRTNGGSSAPVLVAPLAEKQPWAASGILTFLGDQQLRAKKWQESLPLFDGALKLNDKNLLAWQDRARAKLRIGDWDGAVEDLAMVRKWDPEVFRGIMMEEAALFAFSAETKKPEVAKKLLELLEKEDKDPALALAVKAMRDEMGGAKEKAAQTLKDLLKIEKNPDKRERILVKIADLYIDSGKSTEAKEYYSKALEIDPYLPSAANNYAWIAGVEEKDTAVGYLWVYRALSREPQNPHILDTLAELYFLDGKATFAVQTEKDALQITPQDPTLLEHLKKYEGGAPEDLWGSAPKEKPVL